jgi:hypothetical protein
MTWQANGGLMPSRMPAFRPLFLVGSGIRTHQLLQAELDENVSHGIH